MTPSGFTMGTILKTKFSRRAYASAVLLTRNSMTPFIIQLAFDSPGCTLDEMKTPFLLLLFSLLGSLSLLVIVIYSHRLPASVRQSVLRWKKFWLNLSRSIRLRSSTRSEYV